MIELVQILYHMASDSYSLRSVTVNPNHIVSMSSSDEHIMLHAKKKLPEGLHEAQQFMKIHLTNGKNIVVCGNPQIIHEKIKTAKKLLLG